MKVLLLRHFSFQAEIHEQFFMIAYGFPLLHPSEDHIVIVLTKKLLWNMWFLKTALPIQPFQFCDSNGICRLLHHTSLILVVGIGLGIGPKLGEKEPPLPVHALCSIRKKNRRRKYAARG